jgi:cyanophycin synthetase
MTTISTASLRDLHGPSVFAGFPALVLEFEAPAPAGPEPRSLLQALSEAGIAIGAEDLRRFCAAGEAPGARHLAAALAQWLDQRSKQAGSPALSFQVSQRGTRSALAASFVDRSRTARILRDAIRLASALLDCAADTSRTPGISAPRMQEIRRLTGRWSAPVEPEGSEAMLFERARLKGIPALVLPGTPRILLLGQGRHGRLLQSTSNDRDSAVGTLLASDKAWSNALVQRLGYPGVRHRLVHHEDEAAAAARAIGFPLVVKPVDSGKGVGVFAGIASLDECRAAIRVALGHSRHGVLVEAQVEGDDHRLAVFGGRFRWAVARRAAAVVGDGRSTVRELVERENARREALPADERPLIATIEIDPELLAQLAKAGLTTGSVPAAGQAVKLRSIANVSKGGTYEDVTDRVHPDNRAMAESIAAAFRMDALGIDFLTTDVSRSWRETGGAVIEVNQTPGAGTPHYVDAILAALFPPGARARVPYLLFASDPDGEATRTAIAALRRQGHVVGYVDSTTTAVDDEQRGRPGQTLNARMQSLLPDPRVGVIVARLTGPELEREGLLLERVDRAFIGTRLAAGIEALIRRHCADVRLLAEDRKGQAAGSTDP